jgi:curli biogenesis system outer membrane secretion channel CsgG
MGKVLNIAFMMVMLLTPLWTLEAAELMDKPTVAVMDFGHHVGATTDDIVFENTDKTSSDYIIEALVESGKYDVVDKDLLAEKLMQENLNTKGIIDPDTARRIGEILGVRYIIYGNVNDVTGSSTGIQIYANGADVYTVKAHIIARMMDVTTGDIVMAAKGEGKSKSSLAKVGTDSLGYITVGTARISQVSVHNSIKKAAYAMVDKLTERLFGVTYFNNKK